MRVTLKAINAELAKRGHQAMLEKGDGYFYFWSGDAANWLDRTVRVPTLSSLTLEQWLQAFQDLKKNAEIRRAEKTVGQPTRRTERASELKAETRASALRHPELGGSHACPGLLLPMCPILVCRTARYPHA
jgi:hypothetical protein